jgi:uncharacterized protein (TIGR03437 family)
LGVVAAQVANAQGVYTNTFQCTGPGNCTAVPIDVTATPNLILYGTGIRGAAQSAVAVRIGNVTAPLAYAGAQGTYAGLDQVNVTLPAALKGRGMQVVTVTANGQAANMGRLMFQ